MPSHMSVDDDLDCLVLAWDTHLVAAPADSATPPRTSAEMEATNPLCLLRDARGASDLFHRSLEEETYFSRVCVERASDPLGPTLNVVGALTSAEDNTSSTLWLLSLVCHNKALMRSTAQLVLQFEEQYADLCREHRQRLDHLRQHHQSQLLALLDMPESATNMIVGSSVTEQFVMRHAEELKVLREACQCEARTLEQVLRRDLRAFLLTSAPDAVARLKPAHQRTILAGQSYQPEVDVSRFAEREATRASQADVDVAQPEATGRHRAEGVGKPPVAPVRTIQLPNPLARDRLRLTSTQRGSAAASTARVQDHALTAAMPPIVLDVSPSSWLSQCLASCQVRSSPEAGTTSATDGGHAIPSPPLSTTAAAIEEHLMRLAHTRTSMLLLLATEAAAQNVLSAVPSPELFLDGPASSGALYDLATSGSDGEEMPLVFSPLAQYPHLQILFTTRLWGANIVLLYTPHSFLSSIDDEDTRGNACEDTRSPAFDGSVKPSTPAFHSSIPPVVEDALQLAFSWNVDMFSVAVIDSKPTARHDFTRPAGVSRVSALDTRPHDRSPIHSLSAQVLSQLQHGLSRTVYQTSQFKSSSAWSAPEEELLTDQYTPLDASRPCPRTVGTRYKGIGARHAAGTAKLGEFSSTSAASAAGPWSGDSPSVPTTASTFNTPMAIRVFLPLPEAFFSDSDPPLAIGTRDGLMGSASGVPPTSISATQNRREPHKQAKASESTHTETAARGGYLHPHSSTLGGGNGGHRRSGSDAPSTGGEAGLKAFVYYACGESALVL